MVPFERSIFWDLFLQWKNTWLVVRGDHLCGDYFIDHDKHHPFSIQVNIESSHRILWLYQSHDIRIPWLNNRYFMESIQPPVVFVTFRWRFWRMLSKGGVVSLCSRPMGFPTHHFSIHDPRPPGNFQHVASKCTISFAGQIWTRLEVGIRLWCFNSYPPCN